MNGAWVEDAVCRDADPELFFDDDANYMKIAIGRYCEKCPVREQCLSEAMKFEAEHRGLRHGVWGGLTPTQRSRLVGGRK